MIANVALKKHKLLFYFSTPSQPTECIDGIGSKWSRLRELISNMSSLAKIPIVETMLFIDELRVSYGVLLNIMVF